MSKHDNFLVEILVGREREGGKNALALEGQVIAHDLGQRLEAPAETRLSSFDEAVLIANASDLQFVDVAAKTANDLLQTKFTLNFAILKNKTRNQSTMLY